MILVRQAKIVSQLDLRLVASTVHIRRSMRYEAWWEENLTVHGSINFTLYVHRKKGIRLLV